MALAGEKILITGATGKIGFPIARSARRTQRGVGRGATRGTPVIATSSRRPVSDRSPLDVSTRRLLVAPRRLHVRLPCRRRRRRRRLATLRGDERPQLRRAAVPLPQGEGIRLLLDRFDLRVPGPASADRGRRAGRATARELQLLEGRRRSSVHLGRTALRDPAHDHPHLLDLRSARRRARRPAGADAAGEADPAPSGQAQQLQPHLRGRLRRARHPRDGGRRHPADRRELGRERDGQRRGLLRVPGELVGVEPIFEYTPDAHTPLWPDVTYMHEVLGRTKVHWRDGFRRMVKARYPDLVLSDE